MPDPGERRHTLTGKLGPPIWFQLAISPDNTPANWSVLMLVTPAFNKFLETATPKPPTKATEFVNAAGS